MKKLFALLSLVISPLVVAQTCPEKSINYWQAFPAGGESDADLHGLALIERCLG